MVAKNQDNTQLARVSDVNGDSPIAAAPADDGLAPLCDSDGHLIVQQYTGSELVTGPQLLADGGGQIVTLVAKAAAGTLYQAFGAQSVAARLWLMVFDDATAPPAGAPYISALPVNQFGVYSMTFEGLEFSNGILLSYSTNQFVYAAAPAGGGITAIYR